MNFKPYIREARAKDVNKIHKLTNEISANKSLLNRSLIDIKKNITNYIVCEYNDNILGCIRMVKYPEAKSIEICNLFVISNFQNKGLGKTLIENSISTAKINGFVHIFSISNPLNALFYKKCNLIKSSIEKLPNLRKIELLKYKKDFIVFEKFI